MIMTLLLAFYLGGVSFFGPVFLAIWGLIAVGAVLAIEKSGYGRNFEGWDYSLRRTVVLPIAFILAIGLVYLLMFLGRHVP